MHNGILSRLLSSASIPKMLLFGLNKYIEYVVFILREYAVGITPI